MKKTFIMIAVALQFVAEAMDPDSNPDSGVDTFMITVDNVDYRKSAEQQVECIASRNAASFLPRSQIVVAGQPFFVRKVGGNALRFVSVNESVATACIPHTVVELCDNCFNLHIALTAVAFEANSQLDLIGRRVFAASSLMSICIPRSVSSCDDECFDWCDLLSSVVFERDSSLRALSRSCFALCHLKFICIPNSITILGQKSFGGASLKAVDFEPWSRLRVIGELAFSWCFSLKTICIPCNVAVIGDRAFDECINLTLVSTERGSQLVWIGESTFANCPSLAIVLVPVQLGLTDDHPCFYGCPTRPTIIALPGIQLSTIRRSPSLPQIAQR
ncbi:MAG: leucine-rich repeat domain-containing protein [Holosporaceae bacterium]|jgi:hypothetical protein|nr:leucine-rich repeat domain-containing protein [Holosporaceae bacterium]